MLMSNTMTAVSEQLDASQTATAGSLKGHRTIFDLLSRRCPGLVTAVKTVIEDSEAAYCQGTREESFLWQHTVYVASMAMQLAVRQKRDPLLPVVTALFHDCGKFENGRYHQGDTPEEETGARIARRLLSDVGFPEEQIREVEESLLALYNENKADNTLTYIVHDADFLVKFGYMGFANFFEKSVLRGMVIRNSILKTMSKELTYAACLEANMFTAAGREMARRKSGITLSLFRNYLDELREAGISDYEIREMEVNCCKGPDDIIPLVLVLPRFCDRCRAPLAITFDREKGIKCERLIVNIDCEHCKDHKGYDFSFCLPEISPKI